MEKNSGNFCVPELIASGMPTHEGATTGQLILVAKAVSTITVCVQRKHSPPSVETTFLFLYRPAQ
jgi:hypothetical protein